jgi:hypothetical protein
MKLCDRCRFGCCYGRSALLMFVLVNLVFEFHLREFGMVMESYQSYKSGWGVCVVAQLLTREFGTNVSEELATRPLHRNLLNLIRQRYVRK